MPFRCAIHKNKTVKFNIDTACNLLSRTPKLLKSLLLDFDSTWANSNEGPSTWTAFDVVGHLIHGEKADWLLRTNMILNDGATKAFPTFEREAMFEASKGKSLNQLLEEFETLRSNNILEIKSLNLLSEDFAKTGTHPSFGPVSLEELLSCWVVHDLNHLSQISRVLAFQYKDNVGHWKEYLPILHKRKLD